MVLRLWRYVVSGCIQGRLADASTVQVFGIPGAGNEKWGLLEDGEFYWDISFVDIEHL